MKSEEIDLRRVEKVRRVLTRHVPADAPDTLPGKARFAVSPLRGMLAVLYESGAWSLARGPSALQDPFSQASPCGYNIYVFDFVEAARKLRLINMADAQAFEDWYRVERQRENDRRQFEEAKRSAHELGYQLVKKP